MSRWEENNRIKDDALAVLIGSGSWFNFHKGIGNSDLVMKLISPILYDLIHRRNISVFWLGLPPNGNSTVNPSFEWSKYRTKDEIAKKYLKPLGVVFIDKYVVSQPTQAVRHQFESGY